MHHLYRGSAALAQGLWRRARPDADGRKLAGAAALLLVRVLDVRNAADGLPVIDLERHMHRVMLRRVGSEWQ